MMALLSPLNLSDWVFINENLFESWHPADAPIPEVYGYAVTLTSVFKRIGGKEFRQIRYQRVEQKKKMTLWQRVVSWLF